MSTFLELCQKVARDSGTLSGTVPTTVVGQSDRLAKIVSFTSEAWVQIQNLHTNWRYLRKEFPADCNLTASTSAYTAASFSITDFESWITEGDDIFSLYLTSRGVADEGPVSYIPYDYWRRLYGRGLQTEHRPVHVSVNYSDELCFGPVPDAGYTVKGMYRRSPQVLAANDDTPIIASAMHDIIKWRALQLLVEHDEAPTQVLITANRQYANYLDALRREQLPQPHIASTAIGEE